MEISESTLISSDIDLKIVEPTKSVGGYRFGNDTMNYIQFNLTYKPKWLHRQFMRIFFGMYWHDLK